MHARTDESRRHHEGLSLHMLQLISVIDFLCAEPFVVLQRDRQMEQPLAGTKPNVPAALERFQAARRSRVGGTGVVIPTRYSREAARAVRRINGGMESCLSLLPPS